LGVIYGANIGTTITGWLVALIGFNLSIQAFALPMIGVGMVLRLLKHDGRLPAIGLALVGFGLFFVGIDILKNAFEGIVATFDMSKFTAEGIKEIFIFLLLGIVMTILTQSSSASIALTITAAGTGMVGVYAAAAMVIGANVGTTTTALLASIGATANAKRVAWAQVIFNVGTGFVALLILPLLFLIIKGLSYFFELSADPGITLALFHSIFNVLGVLLILPFNTKLANFLELRFSAHDKKPLVPKYLDKTVAATPALAVNALVLELGAIAENVRQLVHASFFTNQKKHSEVTAEFNTVKHLSGEVSKFIVNLERAAISGETVQQLTLLLRIDQYLLSCANNAHHIFERKIGVEYNHIDTLVLEVDKYQNKILSFFEFGKITDFDQALGLVQNEHDYAKAKLLAASTDGLLSFDVLIDILDIFGEQLRMAQQWLKAMRYLKKLQLDTGTIDKKIEEGKTIRKQAASEYQ